jgi:hypothetical protein
MVTGAKTGAWENSNKAIRVKKPFGESRFGSTIGAK